MGRSGITVSRAVGTPLCAGILLLNLFFPTRLHAGEETFRWFSVPIKVGGLPAGSLVPITSHINLSALCERAKIGGIVDERLVRLYQINGERRSELPLQFIADEQPRAPRLRRLPATPGSVSYVNEYAAGEAPLAGRVVGELAWIGANGEYVLQCGVSRTGAVVQVPFPPQNFRGFNADGHATPVHWFPEMRLTPQWPFEGAVHFMQNEQLITSYHVGPLLTELESIPKIRRPFFYPVHGPDGISLTEFGKPHDPSGSHAHHYSLWIAHADVDGRDFWSEKGGLIAHEKFELMEDGPIFCRAIQNTRWIFHGTDLLHDKRRITLYKEFGGFRLIDIELELSPADTNAVTFGKTSFGFLAARVAQSMTPFDGGGEIRNSEGDLNERGAHQKRARWIDQSGPVRPNSWGGIGLFDHPRNPNYPTWWHCRNDGWAGASFNFQQPYTVDAGKSLHLRYRVHLHLGNALEAQEEKRFQEYAASPEITFGEPSAN